MEETTLHVKGMSCKMCVKHVTEALEGINGVQKAQVSLDEETAHVRYDPNRVNFEQFRDAVAEAGYEVVE